MLNTENSLPAENEDEDENEDDETTDH